MGSHQNNMGRKKKLMTVMETIISYIGTPNDPVGWVIVICFAGVTFIMLLEMIVYALWKVSTVQIG